MRTFVTFAALIIALATAGGGCASSSSGGAFEEAANGWAVPCPGDAAPEDELAAMFETAVFILLAPQILISILTTPPGG